MNFDAKFQENVKKFSVGFSENNKSFNAGLIDFVTVHDGQNGATFYPYVSPDGVISWTNNRELENPPPVNIKGETGVAGYTPIKGIDYFDGKDGATFYPIVSSEGVLSWINNKGLENPMPVNIKGARGEKGENGAQGIKGEKGDKGDNGTDGANGISTTHFWNGTTLTITSASGTSSANLKGEKGDKGDNGVSPKLTIVNGYWYINGVNTNQKAQGANGGDGKNGKDGVDGKTPVKGTDYFTEADKTEMVQSVISALPKYNGEVIEI